ncbi:MAG: amidohydrolase family protein [Clostridia bacterium]|nr:amidohydrolase family protein [Clostridia bacterium]
MIIDFHTHTFPDKVAAIAIPKMEQASHSRAFLPGTVDGLIGSMQKAGIDRSVLLPVATNPLKVSSINDLSIARNGKDGLIWFGCIHPDQADWKGELARIADGGLKGIKIHPQYQGVDIDDIRYLRILSRAAELGLLVLTHAGDDIGFPGEVRVSPEMVLSALKQVGDLPMILAHMGGWKNWERVAQLAETKVYLDTALSLGAIAPIDDHYTQEELQMLSEEQFCDLVHTFGSERILFGTDSPWSDQGESLSAIRHLPLTDAEKENILGKNAAKLLEL